MGMTMPDDLDALAKRLTVAQRRALGEEFVRTEKGIELRWQYRVSAACRCALQRMGVFENRIYSTTLTPLGLALREHLTKETP